MDKQVEDRIEWIKSKYPEFEVQEKFYPYLQCAELNTPLSGEETEADNWVTVADVQDLKDLAPITHELWKTDESDSEHWDEVEKDVKDGVTFAFYWQEDALCWER